MSPSALLATWFGVGRSRVAPGTMGATAALPLAWPLAALDPALRAGALIAFTALAVEVSRRYLAELGSEQDRQEIVIDEVAGVLIAVAFVPFTPLWVFLGWASFRLFDIWKPGPIRVLDRRVHGGLGVVLDDVAAGVTAGLLLLGLRHLSDRGVS